KAVVAITEAEAGGGSAGFGTHAAPGGMRNDAAGRRSASGGRRPLVAGRLAMRTGSLRTGAGLVVLLLLTGSTVRAQITVPRAGPRAPGRPAGPGPLVPKGRSPIPLPPAPVPVPAVSPLTAEPPKPAPLGLPAVEEHKADEHKVPVVEPLHAEPVHSEGHTPA